MDSNVHRLVTGLRYLTWDRVWDEFRERYWGVNTGGYQDTTREGHVHYGTLRYRGTFALLRTIAQPEDKVIYDVGSGKGRFVCAAAQTTFKRIVGIEYEQSLHQQSIKNLRSLRHRKCNDIQILQGLAQDQDYTGCDVMYLMNPFSADIMREVMRKVESQRNRPLTIIYVNPVRENVLADFDWLRKFDYWEPKKFGIWCAVSFWKSHDSG